MGQNVKAFRLILAVFFLNLIFQSPAVFSQNVIQRLNQSKEAIQVINKGVGSFQRKIGGQDEEAIGLSTIPPTGRVGSEGGVIL